MPAPRVKKTALYEPTENQAHGDGAGDGFHFLHTNNQRIYPGVNVFVNGAFVQGDGNSFSAGTLPARLAGLQRVPGDELGEYRSYASLLWGYDHETIKDVPAYTDVVPEDVRDILANNKDVFIESNLGLECEAECITGNVQIIPLIRAGDGTFDLAAARAQSVSGSEFYLHIGTASLKMARGKQPTKVTGFREWSPDSTLASMLSEPYGEDDFLGPLPKPRGSDAYGRPAFPCTPRCGGPVIEGSPFGATIKAGCDERFIEALQTSSGQLVTLQPDASPTDDHLKCFEMLTLVQVEQLAASGKIRCKDTLQVLFLPREQRPYLNSTNELLRSDREVRPRTDTLRARSRPVPDLTTHTGSADNRGPQRCMRNGHQHQRGRRLRAWFDARSALLLDLRERNHRRGFLASPPPRPYRCHSGGARDCHAQPTALSRACDGGTAAGHYQRLYNF